jgi:hypothetical protein
MRKMAEKSIAIEKLIHRLTPRLRWSVWAVGVRHGDSARDGMARHKRATVGDCAALESGSVSEVLVAMVKPVDLRNRDHLAVVWRLDGAGIRAVFV